MEFRPLIDYEKYVDYLISRIAAFLKDPKSERPIDRPTPKWAAEELLNYLSANPVILTPTNITEAIVSSWRKLKSEICLPEEGIPLLAKINSIDGFKNSSRYLLNITPLNSNQVLLLEMHPSLYQFVGTSILAPNRKIRFITTGIENDLVMHICRSTVIELDAGCKSDLQWVRNECKTNCLKGLSATNIPKGIIVRISAMTSKGIFITDDSHEPIELEYGFETKGYIKLLEVGDYIIVWKPKFIYENVHLEFNRDTIILRLPKLQDIDPNDDPHDSVFCGIVTSITHFTKELEWIGCEIEVAHNDTKKLIICDRTVLFEQKRKLSSIRANHFCWFFHLVMIDLYSFKFSGSSTVFNLSTNQGFYNSLAARPIPIPSISRYLSGIIRGIIVSIKISIKKAHIDCGRILDETFHCFSCKGQTQECRRIQELIQYDLFLEDGGIEQLHAVGLSNTFDLFSLDAVGWDEIGEKKRNELLLDWTGKEVTLYVSRCDPSELGEFDEKDDIWRIDTLLSDSEETNRTVSYLINVIKNEQSYEIGFTGKSPFHSDFKE